MSWSDKYEPPEDRRYLEAIARSGRAGRALAGVLVLAVGTLLAIVGIVALS